ncbi:MAG: PAS domain-containing protein [Gemmatimonadales bacterium]
MTPKRATSAGLETRLEEAEATLRAIRSGEVDAVVVSSPDGDRAVALEGGTQPYHVLLNAMSDGAALLAPGGTILFANRRLGEIVHAVADGLRGTSLLEFVAPAEQARFDRLLRSAETGNAGEFALLAGGTVATPAWMAISAVSSSLLMVIVTDLTARKEAEAMRLGSIRPALVTADDAQPGGTTFTISTVGLLLIIIIVILLAR